MTDKESVLSKYMSHVYKGDLDEVKLDIETRGCEVDYEDILSQQDTPLLWACIMGHTEIARYLIGLGADVNRVQYRNHKTPLHHAAQFGYEDLIVMLLEAGADINALSIGRKKRKQRPIDVAHKDLPLELKLKLGFVEGEDDKGKEDEAAEEEKEKE